MLISAIRTIILYLVIIITVRLMGKRQISELQTSELVVTLLMSDIASIPMQNSEQSMLSGIIPIFVLLICEIFISVLMLKLPAFRKLICGKPVIVINDGKVDKNAMKQLRISTEDLIEELRQKDVFRLEDVSYGIIETNGKMSILKKPGKDYITAEQIGINPEDNGLEVVIISDGKLAHSSMEFCGITEEMLKTILRKKGIRQEDIFIMTADKKHNFTVIEQEEK